MSDEIPQGWTRTTIDKVLAPLDDGRVLHHGWSPQCLKEPSSTSDAWGVLKTTAIQPGRFLPEHNKQLPDNLKPRPQLEVRSGDILLTCAGPRVRCGVPCLVRETRPRLILSGKMYRFRPRPDVMDPRFLEAQLLSQAAQTAIDAMKTGISDSGLNLTHDRFKKLPTTVAPLQEQRQIVAALDSHFSRLDAATATLERVQRNLERYRASVLKAAVEGRLVPTEAALAKKEGRSYEPASVLLKRILAERRRRWEEAELAKLKAKRKTPTDDRWKARYKEPAKAGVEGLPELPAGWSWATIEQLSTKVVDGVHKKPNYVPAGVPFITVRNLTAGPGISFDQLNFVTPEDHSTFCQRTHPEEGDILVSKDGTLGVVRAIRTQQEFSIFVSVALVKPVERKLTDYLEVAMMAPTVQVQMVPKGSGLQHIHLEDLRRDCIPLPPVEEQQRIVESVRQQLSLIDRLSHDATLGLTRLARVRQAILKWAFEGRLVSPAADQSLVDVALHGHR